MMPKITKPIELIEYAIKANQVQADKFGIQIEVEYPEEKMPKLFVDSEKIAWVLTNLLSNAVRYSKENGRVVIGAKREKEFVELYVQDFGKGIDSPLSSEHFRPLFPCARHKGARQWTGTFHFKRFCGGTWGNTDGGKRIGERK